jgi:hypothetical protein
MIPLIHSTKNFSVDTLILSSNQMKYNHVICTQEALNSNNIELDAI